MRITTQYIAISLNCLSEKDRQNIADLLHEAAMDRLDDAETNNKRSAEQMSDMLFDLCDEIESRLTQH